MKKTAAILSLALTISSIVTFTAPAIAAAPAVTSIFGPDAESVGSVTGGYDVTILGEAFCSGASANVSSVAIGTQSLSSVVVTCDHASTTQDKIVATVPARALADRTIGRQPVVVVTSQGSNTDPMFFGFIPEVDESYSTSALVELGELFSRSQRKPIVRSLTAPFTVTGTDSLTGDPYTYITNFNYLGNIDCTLSNNAERCGAYSHEADLGVNFHPGAISPVVIDGGLSTRFQVSNSASAAREPNTVRTSAASNVPFDQWLGGRTVTELYSDLDCEPSATPDRGDLNPDNFFDSGDGDGPKYSFCSGFGPDIYSEPFVAQAGQSLAFEWSAIGSSDDYAVYAYLVRVDSSTGAIPSTASRSNHELVMYNSGSQDGFSDWQTSTVDVDTAGTYRFRFVNGSYDGTGGYALGSLFYLNSFFLAGQTNEISFGEFDDVVYDPANLPQSFAVTASSTAGGQPTVVSLTPNVCGVTSNNTAPPSYSVSVSVSPATCILRASQGATGPYAPAASVITAFEIYATAASPGSPTLLAVTGTSQTELRVDFSAGPSGGSPVTGYQYSVDGGAWVNAPAGASQGVFTIAGLNAQTTYSVQIRAVNSVGSGSSSNTVAGTTLPGSQSNTPRAPEPYNGPEIISVVPNLVTTKGGETVVVIGKRLGVGDELFIGGIKVKLEAATETGFRFVMPESPEGFKDMLYVYNGGAKLTYLKAVRAVAPVVYPDTDGNAGNGNESETKPWSAIGVANMFTPGSAVVNTRVRAQVVAMLRLYASQATSIECTGFTMGPRVLARDAKLSRDRATAVCNLIKQLRPRLEVVNVQGKQETRLGGAVRRVEVLFTR